MNKTKALIQFFLLVGLVIVSSILSTRIWSEKPEKIQTPQSLRFEENMTIKEFGEKNNVPKQVLQEAFHLNSKQDLNKQLKDLNLSHDVISKSVNTKLTIYAEHASKNWMKILLKFSLWISFLIIILNLLRKGKINAKTRKIFYLIAIIVFGVVLGSDPNPMGTIKDALVLLGSKGVIFAPRLIALLVFFLTVFVANKFICAWGCQLGTLQDLIFRLNRRSNDTKSIFKQYKIPFIVSNTIRIVFFILFTSIACIWAFDIVEIIDPFKVYKPEMLEIIGWIFLGIILIASLFIYRPWCHLLCPFGLAGWLIEKLSYFKINVDYKTCIECELCTKSCPSNVMDSILKQDKVIPDCFSCGTCIEVCPTNSIQFLSKKRDKVPKGMFEKNQADKHQK